jgi:hypothetical protein
MGAGLHHRCVCHPARDQNIDPLSFFSRARGGLKKIKGPAQSRILEASLHVAERLASHIFDQGLARARQVNAVRT